MKIKLPRESEVGFQMAPMIDITFLLIIFFMIVARQTQSQYKKIDNPVAEHSVIAQERGSRVVLTLGTDDELYMGAFPADKDEIKDLISERVSQDPKTKIQLRIDKDVEHKEVRDLLVVLAEAGALDVIFSTYQSDK